MSTFLLLFLAGAYAQCWVMSIYPIISIHTEDKRQISCNWCCILYFRRHSILYVGTTGDQRCIKWRIYIQRSVQWSCIIYKDHRLIMWQCQWHCFHTVPLQSSWLLLDRLCRCLLWVQCIDIEYMVNTLNRRNFNRVADTNITLNVPLRIYPLVAVQGIGQMQQTYTPSRGVVHFGSAVI